MSTPFAESYLKLGRWIIYLEDDAGTGYEPLFVEEIAARPIEALEINLPGAQAEVTDVFGNYYPYIPGDREIVWLQGPTRVVYTGHEKLLKLFFPSRTFQGERIVDTDTRHVRLIVQSEESSYGQAVLLWEFKGRKPDRPPPRKLK